MANNTDRIYWGESRVSGLPSYWRSSETSADGGVAFAFRALSAPLAPTGPGGEAVFRWAYLQFTHSASATVRVTPVIDGSSASTAVPQGTLEMVPAIVSLAQYTGQRQEPVVAVPLVRRVVTPGGDEVARWYVRGQRLQLLIESTDPIGAGGFMLAGVEVEFEIVRKADYRQIAAVAG